MFNDFPVGNISHQGALLFYEWLTEKYNSFAVWKFKKVKFILPDENEWMLSGKSESAFVYGTGNSLTNSKRGYLANYNHEENKPLQLLNSLAEMNGNIVEMISTKAVSKGGSWTQVAFIDVIC
jgi:hypothetical protein